MHTIKPYIDLGWHTVPLNGTLERLEDGTKTIPDFPKDWRVKYQQHFNDISSPLGGTITGECSGIVAIDCDNELTWKLFRSLDPSYPFVFISKGKGYSAGTIIYKYTPELFETFSLHDGEIDLDFYSNRGFIYLATPANKTKIPLPVPLPEITEAPPAVIMLLKQLAKQLKPSKEVSVPLNLITANCLQPLVLKFVEEDKFMPGLFKIITPKDFRELPEYIEAGCLHPDNVPDGRGSEYLSKVSAILGADPSIDQDLYARAILAINRLFSQPIDDTRLDKTIIDPMIEGKASTANGPIWRYDANWEKYRSILQSKRQSVLELCFDDTRNMYYVVDQANLNLKSFSRDSEFMAYIEAAATITPKKLDLKRKLPIAKVQAIPNLPFGFNEGDDPTARILNTFIQTPEYMIFNNPEAYAAKYKRPDTILRYLETLVPEDDMRNYLVRFIKTKLTTFNYSPVVLYFLGAHGSGKDLFVRLLEIIIGHIARPTVKEFLEMFNGWLLDSYFVQLDEYGNQLTGAKEKEEALGKIKAYTGKDTVQVRQMRTDGFQYKHKATFIMTANTNPLMVEEQDRRLCFLQTPNILAEQKWVLESGGIAEVHNLILKEVKDFCYYLATEVKPLSDSDYVKPPKSKNKEKLIAESLPAAQKIAYCLKHRMLDMLVELCELYPEIPEETIMAFKRGNLLSTDLFLLYSEMTDFKGDDRYLMKIIRSYNIEIKTTTRNNSAVYKIVIPDFIDEA